MPVAPAVAPAPTRAGVTAETAQSADQIAAADESRKRIATFDAVNEEKALVRKRQGVFGNIRTTAQGDNKFGQASVARFGGYKAAA